MLAVARSSEFDLVRAFRSLYIINRLPAVRVEVTCLCVLSGQLAAPEFDVSWLLAATFSSIDVDFAPNPILNINDSRIVFGNRCLMRDVRWFLKKHV